MIIIIITKRKYMLFVISANRHPRAYTILITRWESVVTVTIIRSSVTDGKYSFRVGLGA